MPAAAGRPTPAEGASCFVNPLTTLGMVETMRREGHTALVHTAAASNLGQMLNRSASRTASRLVNIVRKPEQAELLRALGAHYVCDSSAPSFMNDLTEAVAATGATLAFDAIGGGRLAGQILTCMEAARTAMPGYSRYGSTTHKQVYIYGGLDRGPTELIAQLRHGLGHRRLAAARSCEGRAGARPGAEEPGRRRDQDHLREQLLQRLAGRGAAARQHRRLQQARHRRESADRTAPQLTVALDGVAKTREIVVKPAVRFDATTQDGDAFFAGHHARRDRAAQRRPGHG